LVISNVNTADIGVYSVMVSNTAGMLFSSNAELEFGDVTVWGVRNAMSMVAPRATNLLAVAEGSSFALALRREGSLLAWGTDAASLILHTAAITNAVAIAARNGNCLVLRADGTVASWESTVQAPTNVPPDLTNAVAISCAPHHAVALTADGQVVAWSVSAGGQTNVPPGLSNVVAIAAGFYDNLALRADGTVVTWSSGVATETGLSNILAIAEGGSSSGFYFALRDDGSVIAWGDNSVGEATPPAGLSNVVAIQAGSLHGVALKADGTATAWGYPVLPAITNVPPTLSNVVAIAAGSSQSIALVGPEPPITKAELQSPRLTGDGFAVIVASQSGRVYALEYKNSPDDPVWTHLPLVAGTGKDLVLRDPTPRPSQRFYRVRRW
jgi:alpha-tubulin suppressor-like RCC1 family protein